MSESIQNSHTSVLPVYTRGLTSGQAHIVYLSTTTNVGQLITIRDMDGFLSTPQSIFVSTTAGVSILDASDSSVTIQQGFGYLTLKAKSVAQWVIVNENSFHDPSQDYTLRATSYSTLNITGDATIAQTLSTSGEFRVKTLTAFSTYQGNDTLYVSSLAVRTPPLGYRFQVAGGAEITNSLRVNGNSEFAQDANFGGQVSMSSSLLAANSLFGSNFRFGPGILQVSGEFSTSYATSIAGALSTGGLAVFSTSARVNRSLFVSSLTTNTYQAINAITDSLLLSTSDDFRSRTDIPIGDATYTGPTNPVVFTTLSTAVPALVIDGGRTPFATTSTLQVTNTISSASLTQIQLGSADIVNANGSLTISSIAAGTANTTGSSILAPGGGPVPVIHANFTQASTISVARSATAGSTIQATTAIASALNTRIITFSSLNTGGTQLNAVQATASSLLLSSGLVAPSLTTLSVPFATILNQNGIFTTSTFQTSDALLSNTLLRPQTIRSANASTFTFSTPLVAVSVAQTSSAVAFNAITSSMAITTIRLGNPITQNPADPYTTISTASGISTNTRYEYTLGNGTPYQPLQIHASLDRVVNINLLNVSTQTSTCYFTANMTYRNDSSISGVAGLRIVNSGGASTIISFNANPYVPFQKITISNYPIDQTSVNSSNIYYLAGANTLERPSTLREYPAILAGGNGPAYMALNANGDTTTWASVTSPFTTQTNAFAWNGSNMWIAGGEGTNHLAYSYNGSNWYPNTTDLFTRVHAVAWNGSVWVLGGEGANTLAYSYDGLSWYGLGISTFTNATYAVAWNGQVWLVGGSGDSNSLAYSYDGVNWSGLGRSTFTSSVYGITWGGSTNRWVAVGGTGATQIAYSETGFTWTPGTISTFVNGTTYGYCVGWNGQQFLAGGDSNIAYSQDGSNWTRVGVSSIMSTIRAVTWSQTQWCIGGNYTTHSLATSPDAITWTGITASTLFTTTYAIQSRVATPIDLSENDLLIGGAKTITSAQIPNIWTPSYTSVSSINAIGIGGNTAVVAAKPAPVDTSGNYLVTVTDGGTGLIYYSTDAGTTWTSTGKLANGYGIAFNGSLWVAVVVPGYGSVLYSTNGISWSNATIPSGTITQYNKVAFGNGRWIVVGNATNIVITSTDGITWTNLTNATTLLSGTFGVGVSYGGGLWIITAGGISSANSVIYSFDGLNWAPSTSASAIFRNVATKTAWNGSRWVIVGNAGLSANHVMYSDDGITWYTSASAAAIITTSGSANSVATNGSIWVVSYGIGTSSGIIYSTDAVNWTNAAGISSLIFRVWSLLWNGSTFIGVGQQGSQLTNIIVSSDGINWSAGTNLAAAVDLNDVACRVPLPIFTGQTLLTTTNRGQTWRITDRGTIFTQALSVAWNGYLWVAVGDANTDAIAYSLDGITWTGTTGTTLATGFRVVAWDGGSWFVYGTGTNTIATSVDGINWTGQGSGTAPSECAAYNGSNLWVGGAQVAVNGNTLLTSANGLSWTGLGATTFNTIVRSVAYNGSNWVAVGGTATSLATSVNGTSWTANATALNTASGIVWSGKQWIAVGTSTIATGPPTITATWSTFAVSSLSTNTKLASRNPLPYGFADSNIIFAGSSNATNKLAISMNGLNWISVPSITSPIRTLSWNGRFWTAGLTAAPAIQILTPAFTLSTPTQTSFNLTTARGFAWGPTLGLAVGEGTSQCHSAYTSNGGLTWFADRNNANPYYFFDTRAYGVAFGENLWVSVGEEGTLTQSRGIRYSNNGVNWSTPSTTAGRGILLGCAVAYYSSIWVVGGSTIAGTNDTLAVSANGSNWNYLSNTTFAVGAYGIAWGGSNFVAVGEGTNTIAYSSNGSNWTGLGTGIFSTRGHSVTWNGRYFVALGEGTNTMAYSSNGINWTGNGTTPFNSMAGGGGISARIQLPVVPYARAPTTTFNAAKTFNWSLTGITQITQTALQKPLAGAAAWDSRARSQESFTASAYLTFTPAQTSAAIMMGLSENPTSTTSFTALNYALSVTATGTLQIYELGTLIQTIGFYATTDVLKITYDGTTIRYFQNATLLRSVTRAVGAALFLSSSFFTPGGQLVDIEFHALYTLSPTPPPFSTSGYLAESRPGTDVDQFSPFYLTLTSNLLPSQWNFYLTLDGTATGSNAFYGDIYIGETKYASTNAVQATYTTSPSTYVLSFSTTTSIGISTPTYLSLRLKATRGSGDTFLYTNWSNSAGTDYRSSLGTQVSFNPNAIEYLQFFHSNANSGLQTSELDLYLTIGSTISTTYMNPSTGMEMNRGFIRWNTTLNGTTIENRFNDTTTRSLTYTGAIYNASDPKVKEGVSAANTDELYSTIQSLPLHRYSFIEPYLTKYRQRDRRQIGVLATEVGARMPAAVTEGPAPLEGLPAFQTIDRAQIQYAHMGATQALMARVSTLKGKIEAMLLAL